MSADRIPDALAGIVAPEWAPAYQWSAADDWDDNLEVHVFRFPDRDGAAAFFELFGSKVFGAVLSGRVAEVELTTVRDENWDYRGTAAATYLGEDY